MPYVHGLVKKVNLSLNGAIDVLDANTPPKGLASEKSLAQLFEEPMDLTPSRPSRRDVHRSTPEPNDADDLQARLDMMTIS